MKAIVAFFLIIAVIAIIVGIVIATGTPETPVASQMLSVQINGAPAAWNDTEPQTFDWGSVAPGMQYTRNLTVTNNDNDAVTLILLTTEPQGSHQSWPKNNTAVAANRTVTADLTLTTDAQITAGDYTWLLLASNSTAPTPTPVTSTSPSPTSEPKFNYTVAVDGVGVEKIVVYNANTGTTVTIPESELLTEPVTYSFTQGDTLTFTATAKATYTFNTWVIDGEPQSNPFTVAAHGSFMLTAKFLPTQTP